MTEEAFAVATRTLEEHFPAVTPEVCPRCGHRPATEMHVCKEPLTPAALAKEAYYVACEKACEAMRLRDEAWAAYEQARAEQQRQLLPQR